MRLSVQNNMRSNRAVHLVLLCSSVVPPLLQPQFGGKLAGGPTDLLPLKSKTASFYKADKQAYLCAWLCHHSVEPKILSHTASQMFWCCDCLLRTALLCWVGQLSIISLTLANCKVQSPVNNQRFILPKRCPNNLWITFYFKSSSSHRTGRWFDRKSTC